MICRIVVIWLLVMTMVNPIGYGNEGFANHHLVRVNDIDPTILVDLRYASTNNFTGQRIYACNVCLLKPETAVRLVAANQEFAKNGYRIKIWDAYRPLAVQKLFWDLVQDENFVAPPSRGSRHNRGGAVDVTLVDTNGRELNMPSAFDDFSARAFRNSPEMTAVARQNVEYLTRVMEQHGFCSIDSEWWHFEDREAVNFPLLDIDMESFAVPDVLARLSRDQCQALVIREKQSGEVLARAVAWEKTPTGWQMAMGETDAVIGKNGFADLGEKQEGDGKSPRGIFALETAFGYASAAATAMPYRQTTAEDYWVDDVASPDYNRWVHRSQPPTGSFERMKPDNHLYEFGLVVEYNTRPVAPGKGSAIFVHVWRKPGWGTAGCVAFSREDMLRLLAWLDPMKRPVIVMGL
ncbi:MAG TPA: M15 family metallopeptidase [Patescibacteria group bacterium]|nr:M15 family metallopeptidase [Patescibacteria group bacterium]